MGEGADAEGLRTGAYVLASSVVAAPLIVLLLTQAVLRQLDPAGFDAASSVVLWIPCAVVALALIIAIARVFSRLGAVGGRAALRYPALIVQLQVGFAIAAVALLLLTPGIGIIV